VLYHSNAKNTNCEKEIKFAAVSIYST